MNNLHKHIGILILLFNISHCANALQIRSIGGGINNALYDSVLNITWLRDANLAATNTFGVRDIFDGSMRWGAANDWIASMNTANYLGYNDWRLPTSSPINGSFFQVNFTNNGTSDVGSGATSKGWVDGSGNPVSEFGYLYYVSLDNLGQCTPDGVNTSSCVLQSGGGLRNSGEFMNLSRSGLYWARFQYASGNFGQSYFDFGGGLQLLDLRVNFLKVLAVRDGDVASAPVPLPATVWMMLFGLIGLLIKSTFNFLR